MELPEFLHNLTGSEDKPSLDYANEVFNLLELVKINKKQVLLHIGEISKEIYFIKSGIIKGCLLDEKGDLHTTRFIAENDVITSMHSFMDRSPSPVHLEAVTPATVLVLKYEDFDYMNKLYPGLMPAFYQLMMKRYHEMLDEKNRMISRDATTRYIKFMERYPDIRDRLPLKDVASFLGIRQQSLSRLRSKMDDDY